MKILRLCFLLLLAVLLPIKGAMAAALLCPAGGAGMQVEMQMHAHAGHHDMGDHPASHHDHGAVDKCNTCSAFCSATPLVSDMPRLPEPSALPAVRFPAISTPAPTFLSGGQDRPPRRG